MRYMSIVRSLSLFSFGLLSVFAAVGQVNMTTWQANLQHTGANLSETILTPALVGSPGNFGLLFTQPLDGQSYGQPLYVSSTTLGTFADGSSHNVVYVATENDSVYALDADNNTTQTTSGPLWRDSLLPAGTTPVPQGDVGSGDIQVELGITATPVIDTSTNTIYVVSKVKTTSNSTYQQYLYALDLKTGATKFGSPVLINPTFAGSASDGTNGVVPFSALHEHERGAMILYNGIVYLSYASHSDTQPYHGELLGYNATTLQLVSRFITTPNGGEAGFWASGAGPAIDSSGNMFISVANGNFDQNSSGFTSATDWGESLLKLPTSATGQVVLPFSNTMNWFTPNNWQELNNGDLDVGSGGLLLLPDQTGGTHPHIMVGGGKGGVLYVIDRDNLGGLNTPDNAIQEISESNPLFITPAYFNGNIYYSPAGGPLKQRAVGFDSTTGGYISETAATSSKTYNNKGSGVFISANGNENGIVWILNGSGIDAYNAANVSGAPIYSASSTVPGGNISTQNQKFALPMEINGKVYYTGTDSTNTGHLFVSGLLPMVNGSLPAPSNLQAMGNSSDTVLLTWTDNSNGMAGFIVKRSTTSNGSFVQVGSSTSPGVTQFTDVGLAPGTTYFYQVVAFNASADSNPSNVASATTFPPFAPSGLVAYWPLDGLESGTSNTVTDVTGNGNNGTVDGEATTVQNGFINGAFNFHGTSVQSNISVPNVASMQFSASQSFTLSAWLNPANLTGVEQAVVVKSVGDGNEYGIWINANNEWVFRGPNGDLVGPAAIQGTWTNVAAVQDGTAGTRSLYVNGALVATGAAQPADGTGGLVMGQISAAGGENSYQGLIDEVRLFNIALTPEGVTDELAPPILEADSNLTQGTAGTFGLILSPSTTSVIEPRKGSVAGTYSVALHFAAPVSGITATLGLQNGGNAVGNVASVSYDKTGTVVTVALTGVANVQALNLHLAGIVPGNGAADIPLNILWGDVNGDHVVNNLDLAIVQNSFAQPVTQSSALYDINGDGVVNSTDASLVSSFIGTNLGPQTDANLAVFQPATASSVTGGNVAKNAFDNNPNTRWESVQGPTADPSWLEVDLGSPATIHSIVLNWENAAGKDYTLQVSSDNTNWTTIVTVTGNTNGGIKNYPNLNAVGRYVRMFGTMRTTQYGYSLFEMQVFGIPASSSGGTAPSVTSASTATGTVGTPFSYQIAASQSPTSFNATGLPAGLTVNTTTGAITGTPTTSGTNSVTISASNAAGTGSATLAITINPADTAPSITSALTATGTVGSAFSYQIAASQNPTSFNATGLPAGLTVNTATGVITGTPTTSGASSVTISASNAVGTGSATLTIAITPAGTVPSITSVLTATGTVGTAFSYQIVASQNPTSFNATGLPVGLTVNTATGAITGMPTTAGTSNVIISAQNAVGTGTATLTLSINPASAPPGSGTAIYQIDSGSTAAITPFVADEFFGGGGTSAVTSTITTSGVTNPAPMKVYQTERFGGGFTYTIPALSAGDNYTVRLHFAETFWKAAGKRLFNVAINGTTVLSNFDVFATAGGPNIAIVEAFTATANSSGQIVISFTAGSADLPAINGIEILTNGGPMPAPVAPVELFTTAGNNQVSLTWSAGNGPTGTYSLFRGTTSGGEANTPIASGLTATNFIDKTVTNQTQYFYTVKATNSAGTSAPSNEVNATPGAPVVGTPIYQVNAGGGAVVPYAADEFSTGGNSSATAHAINTGAVITPAPMAVYQTERSGANIEYVFPNLTPGAEYLVRLHFAEFFWTSAGQRVFNVVINGTPVLQNFDIIATAGAANTAVVEQFMATATTGGTITVTYSKGPADQPKASALEIYQP